MTTARYPPTKSATGGMTNRHAEWRRDAHHILLDLDAIGESIIPEAKSIEFIKTHGAALREILREKAGL